MKWKQVKDEIPPLNKNILIGKIKEDYTNASLTERFEWYDARVKRPYDEDKKYNENYYTWKVAYVDQISDLTLDYFWAEVETPDFFVEDDND